MPAVARREGFKCNESNADLRELNELVTDYDYTFTDSSFALRLFKGYLYRPLVGPTKPENLIVSFI